VRSYGKVLGAGQKSFFHLRIWSIICVWIQQGRSILPRFDLSCEDPATNPAICLDAFPLNESKTIGGCPTASRRPAGTRDAIFEI
jgi:hypothetical protein